MNRDLSIIKKTKDKKICTSCMFSSYDALEEKGYKLESAGVEKIPQTTVKLTDEHDILMMEKLIENLEDNDDVQEIYHNWEEE